MKYLHYRKNKMFAKKYTAYLLFGAAYIGALVVEKPVYTGETVMDCFSYLATILTHLSIFTLLISANSFFLIPNLLEKKFFGAYALALIALVIFYAASMNHYNRFIHETLLNDPMTQTSSGYWDNLIYGTCCTVITSMLYVTEKWAAQQEQFKNSQISQLQSELKYLRMQINPHFLFNGLNTVYGSIDKGNSQARNMLVQFSDLLRYNLYEADVDLIAMEKEVKHLRNFVALQKARSNENLEVTLDIHYEDGTVKIAPLIFMAFVENAFKYASRNDQSTNRIFISLKQESGKIEFVCENTFDEGETSSGGIGLINATRRLELLYKDRYHLDIKKENNIYRVQLTLIP
jgi:two-component system LytT family sensor kinase